LWRLAQRELARFFGGAGSGETDPHLLSSKLTEPRANQQGKQVRIFRQFKILIFVLNIQLLIA
jgi:hypothetical protein